MIFYDISFNPQVDRQAEDRCHRLGQKKEVKVITVCQWNTHMLIFFLFFVVEILVDNEKYM